MIAALRVAWAFVSPAVVWQIIGASLLVVGIRTTGDRMLESLLPIPVIVTLVFLAGRVARLTEVRIWRHLPDGPRALARGVAIIVIVTTLWLGSLYAWTAPQNAPLRFGHVLALYVPLSLLGFALLLGAGRRLPQMFVLLAIVISAGAYGILLQARDRQSWVWMAAALVCAALWSIAAFGKLPRGFASGAPRARERPGEILRNFANLQVLSWRSPVVTLLRAGRGVMSLPVAALLVVAMSAAQVFLFARSGMVDSHWVQTWVSLWLVVYVVFLLGSPIAERARRLWLRTGDSRAGLFRLCERMLLRDALVLATLGWLFVVGPVFMRGGGMTVSEALRTLAALGGAVFAPVYLSLSLSTLHAQWARISAALFGNVFLLIWPVFCLWGVGAREEGAGPVDGSVLLALLVAAAAMRGFAVHRWTRIDWARLRPDRLGRAT